MSCKYEKFDPDLSTHYPNYRNRGSEFNQSDNGFGFSNFAVNQNDINTINRAQSPPNQRQDEPIGFIPETTQEFARSEAFLFREKYSDFLMTEQPDAPNGYIHYEAITKTIEKNPLIDLFFSERNVQHVLKLSCQLVSLFSDQYKVSPESQNKNELLAIFRSIYLQTPTNPYSSDLESELCVLNRATIDWIVPRILVNIQQYLGYMRDESMRPTTIPRAQNVNIAGTKTNKFWGGSP